MATVVGRAWVIPPRSGVGGALYMADILPALTLPGTNSVLTTSANGVVTVSRSGGTLYTVMTLSATPPSVAQIKAGQNELGAAAVKAANQVVSSVGVKTFAFTGLSGTAPLYVYFVQTQGGNDSNVAAAASFTLLLSGALWTADITDPLIVPQNGERDLRPFMTPTLPAGLSDPASYPSGVTLTMAPYPRFVAGPTASGSTSGHVLTMQTTQLADWNSRIGAAGVLWAHAFPDNTNVNKWAKSTDGTSGIHNLFIANQGIIPGYGCLRQVVPAGSPAIGSDKWSRPMAPVAGDINQPGKPISPATNWTTHWQSANIPMLINDAYAGTADNTPNPGNAKQLSNELYIQLRWRPSANRFASNVTYGKAIMIGCHFLDATQEIVFQGKASNELGLFAAGSAVPIYMNFGALGSGIDNPQSDSSGVHQPGGFPLCNSTTANSGACYLYQAGVWHTMLIHLKPGTRPPGGFPLAPIGLSMYDSARNSTLEVSIARPGETSYTLVYRKTDLVFLLSGGDAHFNGYPSGSTPWGFSQLQLDPFTGGGGWQPNGALFTHDWDQIICSINPIVCPQV